MRYRIIVISDTHGRFHPLYQVIEKHKEEATCFFHLGDGQHEVDDILTLYPDLKLYTVPGNCDFGASGPFVRAITIGGKNILFTHGHTYHVKYGLYELKQAARSQHADIALFGHTHSSYTEYEDGLYIMNPGSAAQPRNGPATYGIIDITDAGIVLNLVKL